MKGIGMNVSVTASRRQRRAELRKKRRLYKNLIAGIFILALIIAGVSMFGQGREAPLITEVNGVQVHQDFLAKGIPGRPGETRRVKYIVVHETGNTAVSADAASHNKYIKDEARQNKLSWHYTVDDKEIYQHLPDNEIGYHAGTAKGNKYGIGVELCVNSDGDYEKTLENGAALVAQLLKNHGLNIRDVKQHYDFSGKNCPEIMRETGRWDEFIDMIEQDM